MGFFNTATRFKEQNYQTLRSNCKENKFLYEDSTFPANNQSLSPSGRTSFGNVVWKRPKELSENPQLFSGGVDASDVCQGQLGNCWLVSAMAVVASHKNYWKKVIPDHEDQGWNPNKPDNYAGIFRFRFWRYGDWIEVVIDDQLPTKNGELIFAHSKDPNEFWSALIEKAYAKLIGGYDLLVGGQESEGIVDFTGGIPEIVRKIADFKESEEKAMEFFEVLKEEIENGSLIGASIESQDGESEGKLDNGLISTHAYSITAVREVKSKGSGLFNLFNRETIQLFRIRNPWGAKEWTGAFSDGSEEWNRIKSSDKSNLGISVDDDGEFWMSLDDFLSNFSTVSLVRLTTSSPLSMKRRSWREAAWLGTWQQTYATREERVDKDNQYYLEVTEPCDLLIHQIELVERLKDVAMGLLIIKVEVNRQTRLRSLKHAEILLDYKSSGAASLCLRRKLDAGAYIFVSSLCAEPPQGFPMQFMLRTCTSKDNTRRFLRHELPVPPRCLCLGRPPHLQLITIIRVTHAVDLDESIENGQPDPFCQVSCEKVKVKTQTCKNSLAPNWEERFIFYRFHPTKEPIVFKIYNDNTLINDHIGQAELPYTPDKLRDEAILVTLPLTGANPKKEPTRPGHVVVSVWHTESLDNL